MKQAIVALVIIILCIATYIAVRPRQPTATMTHLINVQSEQGFLQEMIPHHQEAIEASQLVITQTQDPEFRAFLQAVIDIQSQEVMEMKSWHQAWFASEYATNSAYMPMMGDLKVYEGERKEKMYVIGMVRHHEGAIEMAKQVLALNPRDEIVSLARAIIDTQQHEVEMMQHWLETKYALVEAEDPVQHELRTH